VNEILNFKLELIDGAQVFQTSAQRRIQESKGNEADNGTIPIVKQ
jgi:hypothetical protein